MASRRRKQLLNFDENGNLTPMGLGVLEGPVDIDGKPVERPKDQWPYSYSEFVLWRGGSNSEYNEVDYSDRFFQWNPEKHKTLCQKHLPGKRWYNANPKNIEAFLQEYHDAPDLKLILLVEGCNPSKGYPYWIFYYHTTKWKKTP